MQARSLRNVVSEAGSSLRALLALVVVGLGAAAVARAGDGFAHSSYSGGTVSEDSGILLWLVDGFNLLHATVLSGRERSGWWRTERRSEVIALAERFPGDVEVWVVFDGARPAEPEGSGSRKVGVAFAPSADEWLVRRVKGCDDPARVAVVTADRRLAARVRQRGAAVVSPRCFLERCR